MSRARFGLYQPFIEDRNVRRLYQLKVRLAGARPRRVPMTRLLNRILDRFFDTNTDGEVPPWLTASSDPSR